MGRFAKRLIGGLTAALMLATGAFAADALIDDNENGTPNQNYFEAYWYFYEEGGAKITNAGPPDDYGPVSFSRYSGGHESDYSAAMVMDFSNASGQYPETGMGSMLTEDDVNGMGSGFNPSAFTFWAKGTAGVDTVFFKVETVENGSGTHDKPEGGTLPPAPADIKDLRTYNAWGKPIKLSTEWTKYTVNISNTNITSGLMDEVGAPATNTNTAGDLKQAAWWGRIYNFQKSRITKLAWAIKAENNSSLSTGTFQVDDIYAIGYEYVSPMLCTQCVGTAAIPGGAAKFSDFESPFVRPTNDNERQNGKGYYWYFYTDAEAGGGSSISGGTTFDEYSDGDVLDVTGRGDGGNAAYIEFTMGEAFTDASGTAIAPFVGIGTSLYDDVTAEDFYNAASDGATGIYFEYKTSVKEIAFEVEDFIATTANDANVWQIKLPGETGTSWKGATVDFNTLRLPSWATRTSALDKGSLTKLQFKYQGTGTGNLGIDNVYLIGSSGNFLTGVKLMGSKAPKATGLRATYSRGTIGVNWNAAQSVASGKVSLVNVRGRVVASAPIKMSGSKITANLGAGTIPTGMYFVRVNAKDVNGKKIVQQAPISIVK